MHAPTNAKMRILQNRDEYPTRTCPCAANELSGYIEFTQDLLENLLRGPDSSVRQARACADRCSEDMPSKATSAQSANA
jgi:hypothetical protein